MIVQSANSELAAALTRLNGGRVDRHLHLVHGASAEVIDRQLDRLRRVPGVVVTPDTPVTFDQTDTATRAATAVFPAATGADSLTADGIDGRGVTVAVLDTGLKELPDFSRRLIGGVDLSGEGNPWKDSYGHGTFVTGLIAGNGASSSGLYKGEAPGANLVSIKVSGANGAVTQAP